MIFALQLDELINSEFVYVFINIANCRQLLCISNYANLYMLMAVQYAEST